jgi:general secretion pathway protein B
MSSILKALKKLDAEKSARKPGSIKIDAEILRGETRARISPLGISLASMLLFACGGVATYLYMKPETNQVVSTRNAAPSVIPAERIIPEAIVPATSMAKTEFSPATPTISAPAPSAAKKLHNDHPSAVKTGSLNSVKILPNRTVRQPTAIAEPTAAPAKAMQVPVSRQEVLNPPMLRVNGIAFQDGVDSVAMINGVQVIKGSTIEGVRIVDIKKDRVLFSLNGVNFEIALGKSNR